MSELHVVKSEAFHNSYHFLLPTDETVSIQFCFLLWLKLERQNFLCYICNQNLYFANTSMKYEAGGFHVGRHLRVYSSCARPFVNSYSSYRNGL